MNWQRASTGALLALLVVTIQAQDADYSHYPAFVNTIMPGGRSKIAPTSWQFLQSEDGALELVDLRQTPVDSEISIVDLRNNVKFYLFTVSNTKTPQVMDINDPNSLKNSNFRVDKPTRIIIHGWRNHVESPMNTFIRDAYLNLNKYNVIVVDWSYYARGLYAYARARVFAVGQYVGQMINYLENNRMHLDSLIVIGHSLGAHVAGVGCRNATHEVAALVGLDPAGPLFEADIPAILKPTDAKFVQAIHTNAGTLGYRWALGTIDVWPNGGKKQPGCGYDFIGTCAHARAYLYFAESVGADISESRLKFVAHHCKSYDVYMKGECTANKSTNMGGSRLDTNVELGNYFLLTNAASPYAKGGIYILVCAYGQAAWCFVPGITRPTYLPLGTKRN